MVVLINEKNCYTTSAIFDGVLIVLCNLTYQFRSAVPVDGSILFL